jgi:HEAT repeat protein/peptidyl-tRNA hydrolase
MATTTRLDYGVVLKQMNGAIRTLEMYPSGHPATLQAMIKPFAALQEVFKNEEHLIISRVEDKIVVNGKQIEGTDLLKRFLDEFENQNITSITLTKSITKEELNKFLGFFVKPLGKTAESISLPEYITRNKIRSIRVDLLRYELVTEDEVVVKSDVLQGADLKGQISKIIKENPHLVRDILLNKPSHKENLKAQFDSQIEPEEVKGQIGKEIKQLSDDDILTLLVSGLEQNLEKSKAKDASSVLNEVVDLANKLLEEREKTKLLPRIKKMLSERGIAKTEHLDFLFEEKWLKSQEVIEELMRMIQQLGTEEVDPGSFSFLWHRVMSSEDSEIKSYAIDKLFTKFDSEDSHTRTLVVSTLEKTLESFIQNQMGFEFTYVKERLYQRVKDQNMPAGVLRDCSWILKRAFVELINQHKFREAQQILDEYKRRQNPQGAFPEDVKEIARDFLHQVSSESTIATLTSQMKEGTPFQELKMVEEMLEVLDGNQVAEKLLNIFTLEDRAARISALRVLSRLGKNSVSAFSNLISDFEDSKRDEKNDLLADEHWYKVRNVIYVLGNISDSESIKLLDKLSRDADVRVRLEVTKALEKLAQPESTRVLLTLLKDKDDEVRTRVIASLATLGDPMSLEPLKEHLRKTETDMPSTIAAIARVGKEKAADCLLDLLWEREGTSSHQVFKTNDETKIAVLNALSKIGSPQLTDELEKFVKHRGKGIRSLLVKDKVTEVANRILKTRRNKNMRHSDDKKEKVEETPQLEPSESTASSLPGEREET